MGRRVAFECIYTGVCWFVYTWHFIYCSIFYFKSLIIKDNLFIPGSARGESFVLSSVSA